MSRVFKGHCPFYNWPLGAFTLNTSSTQCVRSHSATETWVLLVSGKHIHSFIQSFTMLHNEIEFPIHLSIEVKYSYFV